MKKGFRLLLLLGCSLSLVLCGCRRTPIELETESETETETETESETETETEKQTEKQTEKKKEKETEKTATKQTEKTTVAPNTTNTSSSAQPNYNAGGTSMCPYCYNYFSTQAGADGSSVYSSHVAQEEAYIASIGGVPITDSGNTNSNNTTNSYDYNNQYGYDLAQCEYCFQWFSTTPDASGYSPYAQHVAGESAYYTQADEQDYYQCPYCGNWVTYTEYQYHTSGGY